MLTKDTRNGMVFGVCSGIARWLGVEPGLVRLLVFISFFITASLTFWTYLILALVLPDAPHEHEHKHKHENDDDDQSDMENLK